MSRSSSKRIDFPANMRTYNVSRSEAASMALEALRGTFMFLSVIFCAVIIWIIYSYSDMPRAVLLEPGNLKAIGAIIGTLTGGMAVVSAFAFYMTWRRILRQKIFQSSVAIGFDQDALYDASELLSSRIAWDYFIFFRESKHAFIYYDGVRIWFVPKRIWKTPELDRLRALSEQKVPHRRPLFRRRKTDY